MLQNRLNPPATKLFCGGIADITDEEFRTYWEQFGELSDCAVVRDASGHSRGFGFVTFKEQAGVIHTVLTLIHAVLNADSRRFERRFAPFLTLLNAV